MLIEEDNILESEDESELGTTPCPAEPMLEQSEPVPVDPGSAEQRCPMCGAVTGSPVVACEHRIVRFSLGDQMVSCSADELTTALHEVEKRRHLFIAKTLMVMLAVARWRPCFMLRFTWQRTDAARRKFHDGVSGPIQTWPIRPASSSGFTIVTVPCSSTISPLLRSC